MEGPGWRVEQLGARGRGVVATRAFQPGDCVLSDAAFAWALFPDRAAAFCDCCLAPADGALRCSACKLSSYASKEHQARAWREGGHRAECAALRACAPRVPPTAVRLALRCALRRWAEEQGGDAGGRAAQVEGLQHHWERLSDAAKLQYAQQGALVHRLLEAAAPEAAAAATPRDLALLVARIACNSHTISDDDLQPVGVGVFPLGAMANHDCAPNAVHAVVGRCIHIRAVRRIAPGEEVNTAYTDLAATRWERRRELLHHHVFDIAAAAPAPAPAAPAHAASTSSGPATGSAAAGGAAAALQCLPGQPPEAAAALPAVDAELRLYRCGLPPWPHDERDVDLTAVSSSSFSTVVGMWGSLGHEDSLGAVPAAASFGMRQGDGEGDEASASAAAACEAAGAPPPAALVHCWGPSLAAPLPEVQQLAERYMAALRLQRSLDDLLASGRAAAAVARLQQALAELCGEPWPGSSRSITSGGGEAAMSLGPRHVLRMRLLADLHRAAVAAGDWDAALQSAHLLLPLYQAGYPPVWPQLGLLWAGIAKLEHLAERPHRALPAAQAAARILAATHGGAGPAAEAVARVALEAQHELAHMRQRGQADEDA